MPKYEYLKLEVQSDNIEQVKRKINELERATLLIGPTSKTLLTINKLFSILTIHNQIRKNGSIAELGGNCNEMYFLWRGSRI